MRSTPFHPRLLTPHYVAVRSARGRAVPSRRTTLCVERFLGVRSTATAACDLAHVSVTYEAATDGKDQRRYVAGADAKATYATRLQMGDEAFRKAIAQQFFGLRAQA